MTNLARDLMTRTVVTIDPNTSILDVLHVFVVANITGGPVVEPGGAVIGMLSTREILLAIDQACDDEIDERDLELPVLLRTATARELAVPEIVWVAPDATIASVADTMRSKRVRCVLVGQPGQLAGVLTAFDLLAAMT